MHPWTQRYMQHVRIHKTNVILLMPTQRHGQLQNLLPNTTTEFQKSHLHIGDSRERKERTVRCAAASHSLMTSPERYAALIFPLPCLHHTHTHAERERGLLSSLFVSPAAAAAAAPAYTSNLGHVQERHNSSHHSSTQAKFRTRCNVLMQTMSKYIFL